MSCLPHTHDCPSQGPRDGVAPWLPFPKHVPWAGAVHGTSHTLLHGTSGQHCEAGIKDEGKGTGEKNLSMELKKRQRSGGREGRRAKGSIPRNESSMESRRELSEQADSSWPMGCSPAPAARPPWPPSAADRGGGRAWGRAGKAGSTSIPRSQPSDR